MKTTILPFVALIFMGTGPASALTLSLSITGLVNGTPSPFYAGVGPGSAVLLNFDLPGTDGSTLEFYPLSAAFIGLPPAATGRGFGFGPPQATVTPVSLGGDTGNLGDPSIVQLHQVTLTGANPVDLTQYTQFPQQPLPLGPAIEAAALAGDLTQGTLTLVDQVGPGPGNRWTYTFAVVPEPSVTGLALAFLLAPVCARRRSRA